MITKELDKFHFVSQGGNEVLDTTTLGGDIVKIAEARRAAMQQLNKSKSNVKNN